jgi:hypothetical protein
MILWGNKQGGGIVRRDEFITAASNVVQAVEKSNLMAVVRTLSPSAQSDGRRASPELFRAFASYALSAEKFGPNEQAIARVFKIQRLSQPDFWASLALQTSIRQIGNAAFAEGFAAALLLAAAIAAAMALLTLLLVRRTETLPDTGGSNHFSASEIRHSHTSESLTSRDRVGLAE